MPAPIVAAPFILIRVGMILFAGAVSIGLAVLRNREPEKEKDQNKR